MDIIGCLVDPPKETSLAALSLTSRLMFNGLAGRQGYGRSYYIPVGREKEIVMRYLRVKDCSPGIAHAVALTETKEEILLEMFCGMLTDAPGDEFLFDSSTECVARMRVPKKRGGSDAWPSLVVSISETLSFDGQKCLIEWMRSALEHYGNEANMVVIDGRSFSILN